MGIKPIPGFHVKDQGMGKRNGIQRPLPRIDGSPSMIIRIGITDRLGRKDMIAIQFTGRSEREITSRMLKISHVTLFFIIEFKYQTSLSMAQRYSV